MSRVIVPNAERKNSPGTDTEAVEDLACGLINSNSTGYPRRITLSHVAETYIDALAVDLELGNVELHQLSPALLQLHTFAHTSGRNSRQAEVDHLNWTADRLYAEVCRRSPPKAHDITSYATLEQLRADIYAGRK